MTPVRRLIAGLRVLRDDRSGATAVVTALMLVSLLGFVGLGTDLGVAYAHRRAAQSAADSAAYSAAIARMAGGADAQGQARAIAATYGLNDGVGGVRVVVNRPALSGPHAGDDQAVEVIVERPMKRFFSGLLGQQGGVIRARAVALAGQAGDACVIAFNPSALWAVQVNGNVHVNLSGCSLQANSANSSAMLVNGNASFKARAVNLVGGYSQNGHPSVDVVQGIRTGQTALPDPYADVPVPDFSGCNYNAYSINTGSAHFTANGATPTVFCNGLTINTSGTITFDPGIYVIDRGSFLVNGGANLVGNGVTFVLTSSTGSGYATATMNGTASANFQAPSSGPTAGLLFYQDRRAPGSGSNIINGTSSTSLRGALYFPKQKVTFNGANNTATGTGCTQLLADTVQFNGDPAFEINCQGAGTRAIGGQATELVE